MDENRLAGIQLEPVACCGRAAAVAVETRTDARRKRLRAYRSSQLQAPTIAGFATRQRRRLCSIVLTRAGSFCATRYVVRGGVQPSLRTLRRLNQLPA